MTKARAALIISAMILILLVLALALFSGGSAATDTEIKELTLPAIFSDGMVLQRGEEIGIYGYSTNEGGKITASLGDNLAEGIVVNGRFDISLPPMEASNGLTLTVTDVTSNCKIRYTGVDIGEVWYLSGQSNMNYPVHHMEDYDEYRAMANLYPIRAFIVPSVEEVDENDTGYGEWFDVNSSTLGAANKNGLYLSAIGYVMATRLSLELGGDVTIALIDSTYAGTGIKAWIDEDTYVKHFGSYNSDIDTLNNYRQFYYEKHRMPTQEDGEDWYIGKPYQRVLSVAYNGMTHSLEGYTVRGMVWYQGESHIGTPDDYPALFTAYSDSIRNTFNSDTLPIYTIALAPYASSLSAFQCVQYNIADSDPNVYIIPTGYEGTVFSPDDFKQSSTNDIFVHTARKSPIGLRLGAEVLKNSYGREDIATSARLLSITAEGESVILTFDTPLSLMYGDVCEGFKLAGKNAIFYDALATIDGCQVILSSDKVIAPAEVSYGCGAFFLELEDGTHLYPPMSYAGCSSSKDTVYIVDENGNKYTLGNGDVLRSRFPGNLTNSSGEPVAIFRLPVGYVCKEVEK